ncbi:unnamed protein product, partial [marine sediment metagenome]
MYEINLFGPVGSGFDMWSGVEMLDEKWLAAELAKAGGEPVNVNVNSDGGSVFTAKAMMSAIASYPGHVTATVTALAASSASFLIQSADRVAIVPGAQMMIHEVWTPAGGTAREMRVAADRLDHIQDTTMIPA